MSIALAIIQALDILINLNTAIYTDAGDQGPQVFCFLTKILRNWHFLQILREEFGTSHRRI